MTIVVIIGTKSLKSYGTKDAKGFSELFSLFLMRILFFREMELQDQPDPDYIKMFVGQIPRTMDEEELKIMFSEYGRVHQINVLRDKHTGQSKGKILNSFLLKFFSPLIPYQMFSLFFLFLFKYYFLIHSAWSSINYSLIRTLM